MGRFFGKVGYAIPSVTNGVCEEHIVEKNYYGDVLRNVGRNERSEFLNDNVNVNNSISIIADAYAYQNFFSIKYVEWMGSKWKVISAEVQRPRLILSIGGVYNGE